jgi:hypothetical protein
MREVAVPLGILILVPALLSGAFELRITTSLLVVICIYVAAMIYAVAHTR